MSSPSISVSSSGIITATSGVSTSGYLSTSASKSNTKSLTTASGGTYTLNAGESITRAAGTYLTSALSVTAANVSGGGSSGGSGYDIYTATATSDETSSESYVYFPSSSIHNGVYSYVTPTYMILYQEDYNDGIIWLMAHEGSVCSLGCCEKNDFSYHLYNTNWLTINFGSGIEFLGDPASSNPKTAFNGEYRITLVYSK